MALFLDIASIVLPTFVVLFVGSLLKRLNLIDKHFSNQANRLVFTLCLPLLLFYKIAQSDFYASCNVDVLAGCTLAIVITFGVSYFYASLRKYPAAIQGVFCQGAFRGNLAIIGLAVIVSAFGNDGLVRASVIMGFMVPLLNVFSVIALLLPHHQKQNWSVVYWARQFLLNPLIIASFLGIVWSVLGIPMPKILDNSLNIITAMTLPLALIAIGSDFTLDRLRGDLHLAGLASFSKVVLMPILTGIVLWTLGVRGLDFSVGVMMIGSPTAAVSYIMASQMKGDTELASSIIILSTLFSIFSYSLILLVTRIWFP